MEQRKKKYQRPELPNDNGPDVNGKRLMNQLKAHLAGKHTMITIRNPDPTQTNRKFIKIPGKEYFKLSGD